MVNGAPQTPAEKDIQKFFNVLEVYGKINFFI